MEFSANINRLLISEMKVSACADYSKTQWINSEEVSLLFVNLVWLSPIHRPRGSILEQGGKYLSLSVYLDISIQEKTVADEKLRSKCRWKPMPESDHDSISPTSSSCLRLQLPRAISSLLSFLLRISELPKNVLHTSQMPYYKVSSSYIDTCLQILYETFLGSHRALENNGSTLRYFMVWIHQMCLLGLI